MQDLHHFTQQQLLASTHRKLMVAFSGGKDSTALLHVLSQLREAMPELSVRAVHVNHGWHAQADVWAEQCVQQAGQWGVDCQVLTFSTDADGQSLEAAARTARYKALFDQLQPGEVLLTAQHANDQLETFLLQFLRGAGPKGLSAMPEWQNQQHWRPWLSVRVEVIEAYIDAQGLDVIEDPSNHDDRFDRNFLRQTIMPILLERWPGVRATTLRTTQWLAEAVQAQTQLALMDWRAYHHQQEAMQDAPLNVDALRLLEPFRAKNLLRTWLQAQGAIMPNAQRLEEMMRTLCGARPDALPVVAWQGVSVRRYQNQVHYCRFTDVTPLTPQTMTPEQPLDLAHIFGQTQVLLSSKKEGLPLTDMDDSAMRIGFRQGGEVLSQPDGSHTPLKSWLQAQRVLPWLRDQIPLLYVHEELVAVGELWGHPRYLAQSTKPAYYFSWRHRPKLRAKSVS